MKIYCVPCSWSKNKIKEEIPAIKRYRSERIKKIYSLSRIEGMQFRILSGKFGLLKPHKKIKWYDKKLTYKEIPKIKEIIKNQIKKQKIKEIIFFTDNKKNFNHTMR